MYTLRQKPFSQAYLTNLNFFISRLINLQGIMTNTVEKNERLIRAINLYMHIKTHFFLIIDKRFTSRQWYKGIIQTIIDMTKDIETKIDFCSINYEEKNRLKFKKLANVIRKKVDGVYLVR